MAKGKVFLIGAGPGDPALLTLKARMALESCDVVIYDGLVNREILKFANPKANQIFAGKKEYKKRSQPLTQNEIHQLLKKYAKRGAIVARLKGGDPFLFGRGGEEAEFLSSHRIPFEVVPGVSSVTAVPAYAGIPVTDRRFTSMFTVITGHSGENHYHGPKVDWRTLSPKATLVVLMGLKNLQEIIYKLKECGWKNSCPIACIRWGTLPQQQVVTGMLKDIVQKIKKAKPKFASPVVIVVGDVVKLRQKISWFKP